MKARRVLPFAVLALALATLAGCGEASDGEAVEEQEGAIGRGSEDCASGLPGTYEARTGETLVIRRVSADARPQDRYFLFELTHGNRTASFATSSSYGPHTGFDVTAALPPNSSINAASPWSNANFDLHGCRKVVASWSHATTFQGTRWNGEAVFVKR